MDVEMDGPDEGQLEEELLESTFTISPLVSLDPDEVDSLTPKQRAFLLAYIQVGSPLKARKAAGVTTRTWKEWDGDERFQSIYRDVRSPVIFGSRLMQAILFRAALEHMKLLGDDKTGVRQWAIDLAYRMRGLVQLPAGKEKDEDDKTALSQRDMKALAAGIVAEMPEVARKKIEAGPFAIVEGEFHEVPVGPIGSGSSE